MYGLYCILPIFELHIYKKKNHMLIFFSVMFLFDRPRPIDDGVNPRNRIENSPFALAYQDATSLHTVQGFIDRSIDITMKNLKPLLNESVGLPNADELAQLLDTGKILISLSLHKKGKNG